MYFREIAVFGVAASCLFAAGCCSVVLAAPDWPSRSYRRAVFGADAHNADKMLAQIKEVHECGADTAVITGHLNGCAWYPSRFAALATGLPVDDVVRTGAQSCHSLGLRCVIYVGAPLVQNIVGDNPDWRQRGPDGKATGDQPAGCLMSSFGEWLVSYLSELAAHAPIDGIWLDGYPQMALACSCPHCAAAYKRETAMNLPVWGDPKDAGLRKYVPWWHGKMIEHARKLVAAIHKANPKCAVFVNSATGRFSESWRHTPDELCEVVDCPSTEQFWHVDKPGDGINVQFAVNMLSAAANGKPAEGFAPLFPHTVDCSTVLPQTETLARCLSMLANGMTPQATYGHGSKKLFADLMQEIKRREPFVFGARRTRWCGIAASNVTALQFGRDKADAEYWDEVRGWFRAMVEAHLPVELLTDRQLEEGRFDGLSVILLPAAACISDSARRRIEDFANNGGGVVATSVASLAGLDGDLRDEFGFAEMLGVSFRETKRLEPLPNRVSMMPCKHRLARGKWVDEALWAQWVCLGHQLGGVGLPGRYVRFEAARGREVAWSYAGNDGPAVACGRFGRGRTVYLGPEVGAAYYRYGYPYLRHLMEQSVRFAARLQPSIRVEAPLIVQAVFFEQEIGGGKKRRIVHILNEISSWGRASLPAGALPLREEVIPIAGIKLFIPASAKKAKFEPGGKTLRLRKQRSGLFELTLPPVGLHSMVVIE